MQLTLQEEQDASGSNQQPSWNNCSYECNVRGGEAPFATHKDLYSTIDTTNLGDTPWHHFNVNYQGEKSKNPPPWQSKDFAIWFCNPLMVLHNLLSNPNFNGVFDHSPFQECTTIGMKTLCLQTGAGNRWYVISANYFILLTSDLFIGYDCEGQVHSWINTCSCHPQ